jgi:hypothetical protein
MKIGENTKNRLHFIAHWKKRQKRIFGKFQAEAGFIGAGKKSPKPYLFFFLKGKMLINPN